MSVLDTHPHWVKFYVDGGTFRKDRHTRETTGVYWSMRCEDGAAEPVIVAKQSTRFKTNNDAEWLALTEGITYADAHHRDMPVIIYSDSMLVVKQFNGEWRTKFERHLRMRAECQRLAQNLKFIVVQWVPREVNVEKLGH